MVKSCTTWPIGLRRKEGIAQFLKYRTDNYKGYIIFVFKKFPDILVSLNRKRAWTILKQAFTFKFCSTPFWRALYFSVLRVITIVRKLVVNQIVLKWQKFLIQFISISLNSHFSWVTIKWASCHFRAFSMLVEISYYLFCHI